VVENQYVFECGTEEQMIEFYNYGVTNRTVASHALN